ncbi:MAG: hypothetical protein ACWGN7_00655 [Thermodesulfovibrionales bacterium]
MMDIGKGLKLKAIALGIALDIGGTFLFAALFAIAASVQLVGKGMEAAEIEEYLGQSLPFQIVNLINGFLFTALGGYLAAHIAKGRPIGNALCVGLGSSLIGILFILWTPGYLASWVDLLSLALLPPCAVLGGYARIKKRSG